jgi:hypothetical protein
LQIHTRTNHFGETGIPARAVFGLDFDSFTKQQIESGVNTINDNPINVMLTHAQPQFATTADIYLLHDEILIIDQQGQFKLSKEAESLFSNMINNLLIFFYCTIIEQ